MSVKNEMIRLGAKAMAKEMMGLGSRDRLLWLATFTEAANLTEEECVFMRGEVVRRDQVINA